MNGLIFRITGLLLLTQRYIRCLECIGIPTEQQDAPGPREYQKEIISKPLPAFEIFGGLYGSRFSGELSLKILPEVVERPDI